MNFTITRYLLILPILLSLFSCKKEEEKEESINGIPKIIFSRPSNGKTWYIGSQVKIDFSVAAVNGTVSKIKKVTTTKKYDNNAEEPLLLFDFDMANNVFRKGDTTFLKTVTVHSFKGWFKVRNIKGTEVYTIKVTTEDGFTNTGSVTLNVTDVSLLPEVSLLNPSKDTTITAGTAINLNIQCTSNSSSQLNLEKFKIMLSLDNQAPNPFLDSTLASNKSSYNFKSLFKTRDSVAGSEKLVFYLTDESNQTKVRELVITTVK